MCAKKLFRITTHPITMNIILKGQLQFMNDYFEVTGISACDQKHSKEIVERENIKFHCINMSRNINLKNDLLSLIQLIKYFIKEKPDIVHTHTPKAGLLGMTAAWLTGVPVRLHTVGGLRFQGAAGNMRTLLKWMEKLTYSMASGIYPNSINLKDYIISSALAKEKKLSVIGNGSSNGVDTDYFSPCHSYNRPPGIDEEKCNFGFVGRLSADKGIRELIIAFKKVDNKYPGKTNLVLIGPEEKVSAPALRQNLEEIRDNNNIIYPGRADDIRPWLKMMDIFIFPSYREGFPNVLLEAAAMKLPIIATDINGCNEIVEEGENGLLITPKDPDSLFRAMEKLYKDPQLRKSMGNTSRITVKEKFDRRLIWVELLKEYRSFFEHQG